MTLEKPHIRCPDCGIWWYEFDEEWEDMDGILYCPECYEYRYDAMPYNRGTWEGTAAINSTILPDSPFERRQVFFDLGLLVEDDERTWWEARKERKRKEQEEEATSDEHSA